MSDGYADLPCWWRLLLRPGGYEITSLRQIDIRYKLAGNVGRHSAAFSPDITIVDDGTCLAHSPVVDLL
jgi:hypothetical protein